MSKYRVYAIENPRGRRYIGISEDVANRLRQHNLGESRRTARYRPWHLVWVSRPCSLGETRKLENLLKRQKGGDGLSVILRVRGDFVDRGS